MFTKNAKAHDASIRRFKLQFLLGVFDRIPITSAIALFHNIRMLYLKL